MQTKSGAIKIAAKKLGITVEEYLAKSNSGMKWCTKCKQWKPKVEFFKDATRGDGLSSRCAVCQSQSKGIRISRRLAKSMASKGLKWCSRCKDWIPATEIKNGLCIPHRNEYARMRYAQDKIYRAERRQHAHARDKNVDPIPGEAQFDILEEFNGLCAYCGKPADTWDHIIPISRGGKTTPGNIVPACRSCNSSKKDRDLFEWLDEKGYQASEKLTDKLMLAEIGFYG